jgi:hypothetical protein
MYVGRNRQKQIHEYCSGKVVSVYVSKACVRVELHLYVSFLSALDGCEWSASPAGRFAPENAPPQLIE